MYFGVAPGRRDLVSKRGEIVLILERGPGHVARFKARQPVPDLGGVADLAHFAAILRKQNIDHFPRPGRAGYRHGW